MTADVARKPRWFRRSKRPAQDPTWFRRAQSPGGLVIGEDVVKVNVENTVDPAMNDNGGSYRVSQTGEIISGDNLVKIENWDAANYSGYNASGGDGLGYGKLREEGDEQMRQLQQMSRLKSQQSPGFDFVMRDEKDFLDAAFECIEEDFACIETGDVYPPSAPPLAPETAREVQDALDGPLFNCDANNVIVEEDDNDTLSAEGKDCLDRTCDGAERYGCGDRTGEIYTASSGPLPPKVSRELQQTLDGRFLSCGTNQYEESSISSNDIPRGFCADNGSVPGFGVMAGKIVSQLLGQENTTPNKTSTPKTSNRSSCDTPETAATSDDDYDLEENIHNLDVIRENSIIDVDQSNGVVSPSRLEQLRQNKRALEKERFERRTVNTVAQTIIIPRDDLYDSEDGSVEYKGDQISKMKVGSAVTKQQTKKYNICQNAALVATLLLLSVGTVVVFAAIFWPSRLLR